MKWNPPTYCTSIWCSVPFYRQLNFNATFLLNPFLPITSFFINPPLPLFSGFLSPSSASGSALHLRSRGDGAAGDGGRCWHQEGRDPPRAEGDYSLQGSGGEGRTSAQVHRQRKSASHIFWQAPVLALIIQPRPTVTNTPFTLYWWLRKSTPPISTWYWDLGQTILHLV